MLRFSYILNSDTTNLMRFLSAICLAISLITPPAYAIDGLKYSSLIDNYYQTQSIETLWMDGRGRPSRNAQTLLETLQNSWQHGLNPENYHLDDIQNYLASQRNIAPRFFDTMISDAYLRYVRDMTGMRVSAKAIEQDSRYWRSAIDQTWLLEQVKNNTDLQAFFKSLEPQGPLYAKLKETLIKISQSPYQEHTPLVLTETKLLRPGSVHQEFVPLLRKFLNVSAEGWQENVYDDELVQAVIHFQQDNNLKADGIVGPQTIAFMNKTPRDKVHQIIANMERLRWLDPHKPNKYVLVNIPSQTLWAIENGNTELEMPVIVGRKKRPTLSFTSTITGVRYNPTWTVPKTIKREDYLPLLREDPMALAPKGIDIKTKTEDGWMSIDPAQIDWASVQDNELVNFQMVQGPGPTNPLGNIRILMPNQYNIYLHDTSSPEYFRSSDRAVSSGCVRVKNPKELADFILAPNSNWDDNYTEHMLTRGKMADVAAQQKIPVYLLYLTIWINEDGSLTYGPDNYGWDTLLVSELYNQKKLPIFNFFSEKNRTTLADNL